MTRLFLASVLPILALSGCGNSSGSDDDASTGAGKGAAGGNDALHGQGGQLANEGGGASLCTPTAAGANQVPLYLVIVLDESDSMGANNPSDDKTTKYDAAAVALNTFLSDPSSKDLSASLVFFCGGGKVKCDPATYAAPAVEMQPLPATTDAFSTAIADRQTCTGTPTSAALEGAHLYAISVVDWLATEKKPGNVAVVLATDGVPTSCVSDPQGATVQVATDYYVGHAHVPTYLIGFTKTNAGIAKMNAIAKAGGTEECILADLENPETASASFVAALELVRGKATPCDFALPAPPEGAAIDVAKTNVSLTGMPTALSYSTDCATGEGWQYDSVSDPQKVVLCSNTCATVKADNTIKVTVSFGCDTVGDIPN